MPERRRTGLWVMGVLAFTAAGAGLFLVSSARRSSDPATTASVPVDENSPLSVINQGLRNNNPKALAILQQRLAAKRNAPRVALTDDEGEAWVETLSSLQAGFLTYEPLSRATAAIVAASILDQFGVEPAPRNWLKALTPAHNVFAASLEDSDGIVRNVALNEVRRFWVWMPGRSLTPVEESNLAEWKQALHPPIVRCLSSTDADTRVAAINTLGYLPIDDAAAPAVAYLDDPSTDVRRQVLISFSGRPNLLTVDLLLKSVHDADLGIREASKATLRVRGLNEELISLGSLMTSPKADQRASVIALIKDRNDIDPVVWLLQLSRNADESVRLHAIEALAGVKTPTVAIKRRIIEMARSDGSKQVREAAAAKLAPTAGETTASIPPLPGSSMLNPKAN